MLLSVLGEFGGRNGAPVWTAALLCVLTGLGFEESTARQAIARATAVGWIAGEKRGRDARWRLTAAGASLTEHIRERAEALNTLPDAWDRRCLVLIVSVPHHRKSVRKRLYTTLRRAGFGNPTPGCWATPHLDRAQQAHELISELELHEHVCGFIGQTWRVGIDDQEIVRRAWNLDEVAARYEQIIDAFSGLQPHDDTQTLLAYLALTHQWQQLLYVDPHLPRDLLPDWIGRRAGRLVDDLRSRWAPAAHRHWRHITTTTTAPPR